MQDFNKTKEIPFEYFTPQEANLFAFYVIPKELFTNSKYKNISTDSKLLYGLLRDRNQLSVKNGWLDKAGHIFIYFSREEVCEILGISFEKAVKLFKELHGVGLIKEIRQGLNRPNIIYVGKILSESKENQRTSENPISGHQENRYQDIGFSDIRISENLISGHRENQYQDIGFSDANNTDFKETYINEKEMSQSVVSFPTASQLDQKTSTTDRLTSAPPRPITEAEQKALATIYKQSQTAQSPAKDFVEHVIKKLYSDGNIPYILKMGLTHEEIRGRLFQLQAPHLERALKKSKEAKNKELYFAKALLSAIVELALDDLPGEVPIPLPKPQYQKASSQRDNFEQREYSDEELERFYVNLTE